MNKSLLSGENGSGFQKNGINQLSENNIKNTAARLNYSIKRILIRLKLFTLIKIILKMNYSFFTLSVINKTILKYAFL